MEAKELRIGNWVLAKEKMTEVGDILYDGINMDWNHELSTVEFRWKDIKGIPLTPELLEKVGFEYTNDPNFDKYANAKMYFKGSVQIGCREKENNLIWRHVAYFYGYPITTNSVMHLHQLQNLYFALTGEELEINL